MATTEHEHGPAEVRSSLQKAGQAHSQKIHRKWVHHGKGRETSQRLWQAAELDSVLQGTDRTECK